jgi:L-lactate dehydrogenase complex protein LldE
MRSFAARATYHDSCSGLRELGIKRQPRQLLASPSTACPARDAGLRRLLRLRRHLLRQVSGHLRQAWSRRRSKHIAATGADTLLAGDLGCLMNMAGKLKREGSRSRCATSPRCWPATWPTPAIGGAE